MLDSEKRLFLRLGERVFHASHEVWGLGVVVEVMTSVVPGGTCLVRVLFEDGRQRTFDNDMDSDFCCCYMGVHKQWRFDFAGFSRAFRGPARQRSIAPR